MQVIWAHLTDFPRLSERLRFVQGVAGRDALAVFRARRHSAAPLHVQRAILNHFALRLGRCMGDPSPVVHLVRSA